MPNLFRSLKYIFLELLHYPDYPSNHMPLVIFNRDILFRVLRIIRAENETGVFRIKENPADNHTLMRDMDCVNVASHEPFLGIINTHKSIPADRGFHRGAFRLQYYQR